MHPTGVMWFGTDGGVSSYNGEQFSNLTIRDGLVDNRIHAICDGSDGTLWFGTYGGVSRYYPTVRDGENRFINFTGAEGLPSHFVNDFLPHARWYDVVCDIQRCISIQCVPSFRWSAICQFYNYGWIGGQRGQHPLSECRRGDVVWHGWGHFYVRWSCVEFFGYVGGIGLPQYNGDSRRCKRPSYGLERPKV